mgnify:CR=1 FL=1
MQIRTFPLTFRMACPGTLFLIHLPIIQIKRINFGLEEKTVI